MIRLSYAVIGILFLTACNEDTPTAKTEVSPNGIDYTLINLPDHELVSIQVAWPTDWAYREGVNQAVPYIGSELILAGGAEGFPAGDVVERFADIDAQGYLGAGTDHVLGDLTFPKEHLSETVEIANAHLRAPSMDEMWFVRIRDGMAQNMTEARAQPAHAGFDAVRWAVFDTQPMRSALSLDDAGMFESITLDDVKAWHAETFSRNPAAIVIAGDLDSAAAGQAIDDLLSNLPDTQLDISATVEPDFTPRRILLHMPGAQVSNLAFLAPLPATRLGGEWEDVIITHALGGDDQSVLFEAVRTGLRASYGYGAGLSNYTREHRIMFMTGEVETAKLADAEEVVLQAYAGFLETGPTGPLEARKSPLATDLSTLPEFVTDQAITELQSQLDGFAPGRSLALSAELAQVSDVSIMDRLASAYPAATDFIVIAVSPDATALPGACVISAPEDAVNC